MKYRKKPVVINAIQYYPGLGIEMLEACFQTAELPFEYVGGAILIKTLEGTMRADIGDWIIRGVKGEFYPCKPDIFAATYEPAEPTPATDAEKPS